MATAEHITRHGRVTSNKARNRQAQYRQRMTAAGYVQVTGWVYSHQEADTMQLLRRLRQDETLIPGCLRSTETNQFVSLEGGDD